MGDTTNRSFLSVIATTSNKVKNLSIKDGQLIFIQDLTRIAFDFKGKRKFYNQITELDTDAERMALNYPLAGYYFVIDTAVLWYYDDGWLAITKKPDKVVFIGVEFPKLGQANKIYVNTDEKEISVWDEETLKYITVSNYTEEVDNEDIDKLFK